MCAHYGDFQVESSQSDSMVNTKAKFSSIWNNIKYEFQSKLGTKFSIDSPICFLGQFYHVKMSSSINESDRKTRTIYAFEKFKRDFFSRLWLTYRKDFAALLETSITSDSGWGCMIRSGQMILAQAFLLHLFDRNWRYQENNSIQEEKIHRQIITWLADYPDHSISPLSIHQFVKYGQKLGKRPGDWFGPASVSFIIKNILENASKNNELLKNICCYVSHDCTVYLQDVLDLCTKNEINEGSSWRSVLILVPARLGGERFNSAYTSCLKEIFSLPYCLGVIGGKPRHSLYFVGFQDDKLIYMDPHYCQSTIDLRDAEFPLDTFHCRAPRKVSLQSIDPSCAIGFYLKSRHDFDEFVECMEQLRTSSKMYPILVLANGRRDESELSIQYDFSTEKIYNMKYRFVDSKGNIQKVVNTEEFVLL